MTHLSLPSSSLPHHPPLPPSFSHTGATVVVILVHAIMMAVPDQTTDEELGIVMEDVTVS